MASNEEDKHDQDDVSNEKHVEKDKTTEKKLMFSQERKEKEEVKEKQLTKKEKKEIERQKKLEEKKKKKELEEDAELKFKRQLIDHGNKYDFRVNRTNIPHPNALWETAVHMLMCGLAGGVLAAHEAYMICGIWTALAVNLVMATTIPYCVCILVWSAQKLYGRVEQAQLTYPDVAELTLQISPLPIFNIFAKPFRYIVEATLMFHGFVSCAVFQLMLARNLKTLVEAINAVVHRPDTSSLSTYVLSLIVPSACITMVTDLKNLAIFALISNIYVGGLTLALVYYFTNTHYVVMDSPTDREELKVFENVEGLFEFIGYCVFTLNVSHVALSLENNMDEPKKFHIVAAGTVAPTTVTMTVIGVLGCYLFGDRGIAPILVNLPLRSFSIRMKVFLCLILIVIFAVTFYIAFNVEWFYLKRYHKPSNYWFWERLYRLFHIVVITAIAYGLPDVARIMGLIGCITSPLLFLYPPLIEILLDWQYPGLGRYHWRLIKCVFIMLFGMVVLFIGTSYNIYSVYNYNGYTKLTNTDGLYRNESLDGSQDLYYNVDADLDVD